MLTHCWPVLYLLSPQLTDGITHLRTEKTVDKDKIIALAREAGCHASVITGAVCFNPDVLERFVALVAAHERQKMQTELLTLEKWKGIASAKFGDGRTVNEIEREAREAEREACAKAADAELMNTNMLTSYPPKSSAAWHIAAAIRQRGETK